MNVDQLRNIFPKYAIYVNVPFCRRPCSFCHYKANLTFGCSSVESTYVEKLTKQIHELLPFVDSKNTVESLYFGGGTPSLLRPDQLEEIFEALDHYIEETNEVSMEVHPSGWNKKYLDLNRFTRYSFGVQTFNQRRSMEWRREATSFEEIGDILSMIRAHTPEAQINLDLLFEQTLDLQDVICAAKLQPDSITIYPKTGPKKAGDILKIKQSIEAANANLEHYSPLNKGSFIFIKKGSSCSRYANHEYEEVGDIIGFGHNSVTFLGDTAYLCSYDRDGYAYRRKFSNRYLRILLQGIVTSVTYDRVKEIAPEILDFLSPHEDGHTCYLPTEKIRSFYEYIQDRYPADIVRTFSQTVLYGDDNPALLKEAENAPLFHSDRGN
ncbi:radical SAM protein [Heliobacterium chlorum]|uniref:Heme chaperone HemW n=1 Tax=Heliobacterium chlorum TaxID=2698 RepID=A0ABR7T0I4_HELCL|nr:radical SAM protein [Heliobacterium chlorum]MBC9784304.1 radical SAM protein [Heliobacterium chlorum]